MRSLPVRLGSIMLSLCSGSLAGGDGGALARAGRGFAHPIRRACCAARTQMADEVLIWAHVSAARGRPKTVAARIARRIRPTRVGALSRTFWVSSGSTGCSLAILAVTVVRRSSPGRCNSSAIRRPAANRRHRQRRPPLPRRQLSTRHRPLNVILPQDVLRIRPAQAGRPPSRWPETDGKDAESAGSAHSLVRR